MVGIGGGALESVENQFLEADTSMPNRVCRLVNTSSSPCRIKPARPAAGRPGGRASERLGRFAGFCAGVFIERFGLIADLRRVDEVLFESLGVKSTFVTVAKREVEDGSVDWGARAASSASRWAYIAMPLVA